jgi:hypothetical protein
VARNWDTTRVLGSETIQLIKKKGGIVYVDRSVDCNVKKNTRPLPFLCLAGKNFAVARIDPRLYQGLDDIFLVLYSGWCLSSSYDSFT